jgi:mycoredoxin
VIASGKPEDAQPVDALEPSRRRDPTKEKTRVALTIYSTQWCGYCHRLMKQLDREGVSYDVVDIEHDPKAADYVMSVNGGNQTVPTVVFGDGTALTNPSLAQVKERLAV